MRLIKRTPLTKADPVTHDTLADHLRVDVIETVNAMRYARAATEIIESYCGLALLNQEIVAVSHKLPGSILPLPIGPIDPDTLPTVELIELDGTATIITTGWTLHGRRYPVLKFDTHPGGKIRVTYKAGFGADADALPADLTRAICDQALRLHSLRGDVNRPANLAPSAAHIAARYRQATMAAV